jgi:O-methyltransferase involved in polyketide biosynthesis
MSVEPVIRNISDTALWVAIYRALESERPDALFHDPFARKLAGERGQQIFNSIPERHRYNWAYSMRTYLFDRFIQQEIAAGADMVINLAAGLDARPYRMKLPPALQWITEGLLIYLAPEEVAALAGDLARIAAFQRWVFDITSPGLRRMMEKHLGDQLEVAKAPFQFAPPEGPPFFEKHGWRVLAVESTLKTAARLKRVGFFFRLIAKLPDSKGAQGSRPWSATCLAGR